MAQVLTKVSFLGILSFMLIFVTEVMCSGPDNHVIETMNIIGRKMCDDICKETKSCVSIRYNQEDLRCDLLGASGIQTSDSSENSCSENQRSITLSNNMEVCTFVECGKPDDVQLPISMSYSTTRDGSLANYSCSYGYVPVQGSLSSSTCLTTGLWSSPMFTCERPPYAVFGFEGSDPYKFLPYLSYGYDWTAHTEHPHWSAIGPATVCVGSTYMVFHTYDPGVSGRIITDVNFSSRVRCIHICLYMHGESAVGSFYLKYVNEVSGLASTIWSLSGSQGASWHGVDIPVSFSDNFKLIMEAVHSAENNFEVVAVDNVILYSNTC